MNDKGKYIKRDLKNVGKAAIGSVELMAGVVGLVTFPVIGLPLTIDGAQKLLKGIRGEYIKDSMINVMSNKFYSKTFHGKENRIIQEFPSINQFVAATMTKNKMNFLLMQELNFLLGSDTFDKKGERIKYTTHSQSLTKLMLSRIQKAGFIQDLHFEETKPKALIMERLMLGNTKKGLFKKDKMFEMSFSKTDKTITEEDIKSFLKIDVLDNENYNIKRDKNNDIISINYRTYKVIKDKFSNIKDRFLPTKNTPKMLTEFSDINNDNKQQVTKITRDKNTFVQDLENLVNKDEQLNELKEKEYTKDIDTKSR